jgi:hypothetical protein
MGQELRNFAALRATCFRAPTPPPRQAAATLRARPNARNEYFDTAEETDKVPFAIKLAS